MKATAIDIREYFEPLLELRPWKAKLGYGSFLTFEFGRRVKKYEFVHGEWHLWIYLASWVLYHGKRKLADSDSDRKVISVAVRRLEDVALSDVKFDLENSKTTFVFDDFRLIVAPPDFVEELDDDDDYWLLYMPENRLLTAGPGGVKVGRSDTVS